MESVLLLNASYQPIKVISWKRAVCLWFSGKVEIIEEYEYDLHSVSLVIKAPAVVRLLSYVRIGKRQPPLSRVNILARDNCRCQYCGATVTSREATMDHIIPKSRGGCTSWKNIVCCCVRCNRKKGNRTPQEAGMPLLNEPVVPDWLPVIKVKLNGNVPNSWQFFIQHWYR